MARSVPMGGRLGPGPRAALPLILFLLVIVTTLLPFLRNRHKRKKQATRAEAEAA